MMEGMKMRLSVLNRSNSILSHHIIELSVGNSRMRASLEICMEFCRSLLMKQGNREESDEPLKRLGVDDQLINRVRTEILACEEK